MPIFDSSEVSRAFGGSATYLGTGSFGETWRVGEHALKVIHRDSAERVAREVEGLGRVSHPNVVRLLGVEQASLGSKFRDVLRFEFVDGGDIGNALEQGDLLSDKLLPDFLNGLLKGLEALHAAGVLHRDIKPGNVALRSGDWAKPVILDLGLARLVDMTSITAYPAQVGTLSFMAPEQISGRRVRKAADIFAVGVLARLAVTGEHPFIPSDTSLDIEQLLRNIEVGPSSMGLTLPENVQTLLDRMVSAQEHRRGSAKSCLRGLEIA